MEISRGYDLFLTDRRVSGCRESTLRFYEYVIGKFLRYIKENNLDLSVEWKHARKMELVGSKTRT